MNWQLESFWHLFLLGILPIIGLVLLRFSQWRKTKQEIFAEQKFHKNLFPKSSLFNKIFPLIYLIGFLFFIIAILSPFSLNKEEIQVSQKSASILFLVDVSNSMNAQDIESSRLEQTKNILIQSLNALSNEKVGIVVFAGEAQSIMPLTTDYSSADLYLNSLSSDLIQKQGTDFLLAMQEASKKLEKVNSGTKKVILISDGEDNEGNHNAAIKEAKKHNISVTSIGIGTEQGAPIPEYLFNYYQDYKKDEYGNTIITKRQTDALQTIASETNGKYFDGNNIQNAVHQITNDIQNLEKTNTQNTTYITHKTHYYQWFLGITLFLFFIIYLFNPRKDFNF